jgi:predicted metalloprotease with PDZ domain
VVTSVTPAGESHRLGLTVGCIVVGINGEKFISHAHTVASLKHSKRPFTVRFKKP